MSNFFNYFQRLLSKKRLTYLDKKIIFQVLKRMIPFNKPFKMLDLSLSTHTISIVFDNAKNTQNHLKSMHACALSTVGELSAGILLSKTFPMNAYRLILKDLSSKYMKQAKDKVIVLCEISDQVIATAKKEIDQNQFSFIQLTSRLEDSSGNELAVVETNWQIRPWEFVRTGASKN